MEKIKKDVHQPNLKLIAVKADMKKLPIKERSVKVAELKQLQQEVKTLRNQEQKINDEFTEHQSEVERATCLLQPIQQKL